MVKIAYLTLTIVDWSTHVMDR